ncbi:MAG TPA: ATP-binding protein [Phycisphaerae bacterium]|nr:ATP-binding protein [Phycisphaerae bacterium]
MSITTRSSESAESTEAVRAHKEPLINMSALSHIHAGPRSTPPRILIYGSEGVGKSSTAAQAPRPIFVPTEDGLDQIDCRSFPLAQKLADVEAALRALMTEAHEFQSVVIDSLDWLERLIWDELCRQYNVNSIEKVDGGYAKGYTHALTQWRKILDLLNALRLQRGMCVVLLAHAKVERFEDPEHAAYDRYSPRLHKHATALVTEWVDAALFATRKIITRTEDAGFGRDRTIAAGLGKDGGDRILRTVGSPACVAKNRFSLPAELPLSWAALMAAMTSPVSSDKEISNG